MITVHLAFTGMGKGDTMGYNADKASVELGSLTVTNGGRIVAVFQPQTWLYYEIAQYNTNTLPPAPPEAEQPDTET